MSAHWGDVGFLIGDRVQIHGLTTASELNGQSGIVIMLDEDKQRAGVYLLGGFRKSIRVANLDLNNQECSDIQFTPLSPDLAEIRSNTLAASRLRRNLLQYGDHKTMHVPEYNTCSLIVNASSRPNAGRGVFAVDAIPKGANITQYNGCIMPAGRGQDSPFTWGGLEYDVEGDPFCDPDKGVAQLINDFDAIGFKDVPHLEKRIQEYISSGKSCNVGLRDSRHECCVVAIALADIPADSELFLHYGLVYWLNSLKVQALLQQKMPLVRTIERLLEQNLKQEEAAMREIAPIISSIPQLVCHPNITMNERGLINKMTGSHATMQECCEVCIFRFGAIASLNGNERPDLAIMAMLQMQSIMKVPLHTIPPVYYAGVLCVSAVLLKHGIDVSTPNLIGQINKAIEMDVQSVKELLEKTGCQPQGPYFVPQAMLV